MPCRALSLSTGSSWISSTWISRSDRIARLDGGGRQISAGRHGRDRRIWDLVYRTSRPPAGPIRQSAPTVIHNTIHQTAVHLHQTVHRHIHRHLSSTGLRHAPPPVHPAPIQQAGAAADDASRPAWTARRLLRILSTESARRIVRPFYQRIFRDLLTQEREQYRGRPAQALGLVWTLLGRRQTLDALRRFLRQTTQHLEASALHVLVERRTVRRREEACEAVLLRRRYALRELPVPDDLRRLPAARPAALPVGPLLREQASPPRKQPPEPAAGQRDLWRNEADFQLLLRRVVDALGRQARLESLRQGGM